MAQILDYMKNRNTDSSPARHRPNPKCHMFYVEQKVALSLKYTRDPTTHNLKYDFGSNLEPHNPLHPKFGSNQAQAASLTV